MCLLTVNGILEGIHCISSRIQGRQPISNIKMRDSFVACRFLLSVLMLNHCGCVSRTMILYYLKLIKGPNLAVFLYFVCPNLQRSSCADAFFPKRLKISCCQFQDRLALQPYFSDVCCKEIKSFLFSKEFPEFFKANVRPFFCFFN